MRPELGMTAQTPREAGFWQRVDKTRGCERQIKKKAVCVNRASSLDVKPWLRNCWRFWESPGRAFCVLPLISKHLPTRTHTRSASLKKRPPSSLMERNPFHHQTAPKPAPAQCVTSPTASHLRAPTVEVEDLKRRAFLEC